MHEDQKEGDIDHVIVVVVVDPGPVASLNDMEVNTDVNIKKKKVKEAGLVQQGRKANPGRHYKEVNPLISVIKRKVKSAIEERTSLEIRTVKEREKSLKKMKAKVIKK